MCGAAFYSAICYGFLDKFTQFALVMVALSATIAYAWWLPGIPAACTVVFMSALVFFFLRRERRWAILTAAAVSAISFLAFFAFTFALAMYAKHLQHGHHANGQYWNDQPPSMIWLTFIAILAMSITQAGTCSFMHNRATRSARDFNSLDETEQTPEIR